MHSKTCTLRNIDRTCFSEKIIISNLEGIKMADKFIKNIDHQTVLELANLVTINEGQVISKTLSQNPAVSITLFAFDKGEEIGTHDSTGDAMVTVLEGTGKFTVDGIEYILYEGQTLVMPAKKPHAVYAQEAFKMLLVVVFPFAK